MEYKHTPPTLAELRKLRKQAIEYWRNKPKLEPEKPKGFFAKKEEPKRVEEKEDEFTPEEFIQYELDVIVAHLENQNELLLDIAKKLRGL